MTNTEIYKGFLTSAETVLSVVCGDCLTIWISTEKAAKNKKDAMLGCLAEGWAFVPSGERYAGLCPKCRVKNGIARQTFDEVEFERERDAAGYPTLHRISEVAASLPKPRRA